MKVKVIFSILFFLSCTIYSQKLIINKKNGEKLLLNISEIESLNFEGKLNSNYESVVGFYKFNGNIKDNSGNGFDLKNHNVLFINDRNNNSKSAVEFNGKNSYLEINDSHPFQIEGDLTITFWIKINSFDNLNNIISCQADNSDNPQTNGLFSLSFQRSRFLAYGHENENGINNNHNFSSFLFTNSLWYHIGVVRKTDSKEIILYINGNQIEKLKFAENPNCGSLSTLKIGDTNGTVSHDRFFDGSLDDLLILKKALSDKEVFEVFTNNYL